MGSAKTLPRHSPCHSPTCAVRQLHRRAELLIWILGLQVEPGVHLHALPEFGRCKGLDAAHGLGRRQVLAGRRSLRHQFGKARRSAPSRRHCQVRRYSIRRVCNDLHVCNGAASHACASVAKNKLPRARPSKPRAGLGHHWASRYKHCPQHMQSRKMHIKNVCNESVCLGALCRGVVSADLHKCQSGAARATASPHPCPAGQSFACRVQQRR